MGGLFFQSITMVNEYGCVWQSNCLSVHFVVEQIYRWFAQQRKNERCCIIQKVANSEYNSVFTLSAPMAKSNIVH